MNFYDAFLKLFGLKKRKGPARENWIEYADFSQGLPYRLYSDSNFFLVLMIVLSFFLKVFIIAVVFCCYYRFFNRFGREIDRYVSKDHDSKTMVYAIQCRHNQTLKERLMEEPGLIDCVYQKRSLLSWAKHYQNQELVCK